MPVISKYADLKKPWRTGKLERFFPVRAIGLALEKGWKLCPQKGLAAVTQDDVSTVRVTGKLQILIDGRFQPTKRCDLRLLGHDAACSLRVLHKMRSFLADLGVNVWDIDRPNGHDKGCIDLVCDLAHGHQLGVAGLMHVELKVFAARGFRKNAEKAQKVLRKQLLTSSASSVMLLAASLEKGTSTSWNEPTLAANLLCKSGEWRDVSPRGLRVAKGQIKKSCWKAVGQLWGKMEWHTQPSGPPVGLLSHFLKALGLPEANPGSRAAGFNKLLAQKKAGKLRCIKLENRPGRPVWAGTKQTFRVLHKFL